MTNNFSIGGFANNIVEDARNVGTGLNSLILGTLDNLSAISPWGTNQQRINLNQTLGEISNYASGKSTMDIVNDAMNLMLSPYNLKTTDFGTKSIPDIVGTALSGAYQHPVQAGMDILPIVPMSGKFSKAENLILNSKSKLFKAIEPMEKNLSDLRKMSDSGTLADLIRYAETGEKVPSHLENQFGKLSEYSKSYEKAIKELTPEVNFEPKKFAVAQKILRDNLEGKINIGNVNFADITKWIDDIDILKQNKLLDTSTDINKKMASYIADAEKLAEEGKIFPVTHFGLSAGGIGKTAPDSSLPVMARPRTYGNTEYQNIADLITRDQDILPRYMQEIYGEKLLADNILSNAYKAENLEDNIALNKAQLQSGNLLRELKDALNRNMKPSADSILIDKDIAKNVIKATEKGSGTSLLETLGRNALLAQGSYLGGNILGQATNIAPIAIKNLPRYIFEGLPNMEELKRFGLYTYKGAPAKDALSKVNELIMKPLYEVDRRTQNLSSAIALDNELATLGTRDIAKIANDDLVNIQQNVMANALKRREIPLMSRTGVASELVKSFNPFVNWLQSASISTIHQLRNNPMFYNVLMSDIGANILLNKEQLINQGLNITESKPFTKYELDSEGNIKERSVNFFAPSTPLEFLGASGIERGLQVPFWSDVVMSTVGRNKYGKMNKLPNTIIDRGVRYVIDENGSFKQDEDFMAETVASLVRQTVAPLTFANRTLLPALSPIFGKYSQPYANALLGNYEGTESIPFLASGNPNRPRTLEDVQRAFSGTYESDYMPDYNIYPNTQRRLLRKYYGRMNNDMQYNQ